MTLIRIVFHKWLYINNLLIISYAFLHRRLFIIF